jgi:hypothetical protein
MNPTQTEDNMWASHRGRPGILSWLQSYAERGERPD